MAKRQIGAHGDTEAMKTYQSGHNRRAAENANGCRPADWTMSLIPGRP